MMPNPTETTLQHTGCIVGAAARQDEADADRAAAHYEELAAAAEYPRLLAALVDLYEGRTCKAVEGSARMVVAAALGIATPVQGAPVLGSLADPADLVFEQYGPDGFAWFRK